LRIRITAAAAFFISVAATAAAASVDTSPPPGGVYRLKPGIYVRSDNECGSPANAAIRRYDGSAISDAHSRACRVHVLTRRGRQYQVEQSCIAAGTGPATRVTERQTVTVSDALTFSLRTRGPAQAFRYCAIYQLPRKLRGAAK
jgi:hypothetical protein